MAIKTVSLPILTAGAVIAAATAYAFTRRSRARHSEPVPRDPEDLGKSSGFFERGRVEAELEAKDDLGTPGSWIDRRLLAEGDAAAVYEGVRMRPPPAPMPPPTPVGDAPLHASVPDRGTVSGQHRHELSSMVGDHALAPDESAVGEELVDPGVIEVPVGATADEDIADHLSASKLPLRHSTGAMLRETPEGGSGYFEYEVPEVSDMDIDFDDLDEELESRPTPVTAMPSAEVVQVSEAYDAVSPEEVGTEWLLRATEAAPNPSADPVDEIAELPEDVSYAVSEASNDAARPAEELLEELENEVRSSMDPLAPDADIWKALDDFSKDKQREARIRKS